jgi:drug/metabolite transporter (DMT)-like permease
MLVGCLIVALFWGVTNPLLRHYAQGVRGQGIAGDFVFLGSRPGYVLSLAANWMGSALFYVLLREGDLSLVSPLANGLTFAVTLLCGRFFFGERVGARGIAGVALIGLGTAVIASK